MSPSSKTKFSKGDKVFAKVRGYPPWPARIEGSADETPNRMKYHVYFYGTGETAIVKGEDIYSFVENKQKFGKPKKHKNFTEAMHQIEEELSPEELQKLKDFEAEPGAKDQSANISLNESVSNESTKNISIASKTSDNDSSPKTNNKPKEKKRKLDDSLAEEGEKKKANNSNSDNESKTAEVLSRSGRKIKPKRFADYENDSSEESQPPKPVSKVAPRVLEDEMYLFAHINNNKVRIPLDVEKPVFTDEAAEENWKAKVRNYGNQLKRRLESGEVLPISAADHMYQWGREQVRRTTVLDARQSVDPSKEAKKEHILTEGAMLEIDLGIRTALNIRNADPGRCIELLDKLINLNLTPLMLKKHPDIVQTIKKVRRYIGNVPAAISVDDEKKFHKDTEIIRNKAEVIYYKFQKLFVVPTHKSFWEFFEEERDYFYHQTKNMTTEQIINMVEDLV